ncbi:phosphotransferase [Gymnodinialimonas sp. 2305UL16-5]|uniref:phosphotransferase n=1 Tax=Gymnodinialimonas mytili TaxID=3126503 RepID=UPI00309F92C1
MISQFLSAAGWADARQVSIAGDASARLYVRLFRGSETAILMNAPVETTQSRQSLDAFRHIGAHLRRLGLSAPEEYAADPDHGLILMEDLGDQTLSFLLERDPERATVAYQAAADLLPRLNEAPPPEGLSAPDPGEMADMVRLTLDLAHTPAALNSRLLDALEEALRRHASGAPVLSLRDVHGDNLLWLPDRKGHAQIGLLDYQDAMLLPAGYDLASLVDDPRRVVPESLRDILISESDFSSARIAALSLIRNLRILGIFHRLSTQDSKPHYRDFLPRTRALILRCVDELPELKDPVTDLLRHTESWSGAAPHCLILAAGFGKRMGDLTKDLPKPLIKVAGKPLLDHALDIARDASIAHIMVNAHYHADQIERHLPSDVTCLVETPEILDSGGAVKNAMRHAHGDILVSLNADNVWAGPNPISMLRKAFDETRMDVLLLLVPLHRAVGRTEGPDFSIDADGRLTLNKQDGSHVYTGAQILNAKPAIDDPRDVFSLMDVWQNCQAKGRLFGLVYPGTWADVGHAAGIAAAEAMAATHV